MHRSDVSRNVALGVVAFVATILVLAGLAAVVGRRPADSASAAPSGSAAAVSPAASGRIASDAPPSSPSEAPSPTPAGSVGADARLIGAGDIAGCDWDTDEATAALLDDLDGTIFTSGDNVYPDGTDATYDTCFDPTWGRHLDRIRPAVGNHDAQTGSLQAYLDYFGSSAVNGDGDPWYAYDLGTWRIIVLESDRCGRGECDADSAQGRWLADELASTTTRCTLAIWHHPRWSSGFHGDMVDVQPLWEQLYAAGADVVVNGHDHDYERFAPLDAAGNEDRERGIREFVVGTGGSPLREFEEPRPHSELRLAVTQGLIAFTLLDGGYEWSWIPISGDVGDRGGASCH